ncbi:MAG: S8 family serine peptidase [Clostridia bacterium]|nr:S8 family serine peptidase [Clostridia bacterium]
MIKVAFIDNGITTGLLQEGFVDETVSFFTADNSQDTNDGTVNHGSLCAAIFEKYLHFDKPYIIDVRISKVGEESYLAEFIKAIEWCTDNNVDIINISMGTTNRFAFPVIRKALHAAFMKGIIVVAAMDNGQKYTLPACLSGVIGVKTSTLYTNGEYKLRWYPFDGIDVITGGRHQIQTPDGKELATINTNSFSAPVITAHVSNIFFEFGKIPYDEVMLLLAKRAANTFGYFIKGYYPYFWNSITDYKDDFLWDKEMYSKIVKPYLKNKKKPIETPAVSFAGDNKSKCVEVIDKFAQKLEKESYTFIILSDSILRFSDNVIIPSGCDIENFFSCVDDLFTPDVYLIVSENKCPADVLVKVDDSIHIEYEDCGKNFAKEYLMNDICEACGYLLEILK